MEKIWAVIPARGGSKRLARKNVKPLAGHSLVWRTVKTAINSGLFTCVIVSTDDPEIAQEALSAGAQVPFIRPAHLADDHASSLDVLLHAVDFLQTASAGTADAVCLLQPTSPLLTVRHVSEAVQLFGNGNFNSLSTMKEVSELPEWMFGIDSVSGKAFPESKTGIVSPRASIKKRYIENGALYLVKLAYLLTSRSMYDFSSHGCYQMSVAESVDIDTEADWQYAEFLLKQTKMP